MASSTVENYIKQIYLCQQKAGGTLVAMGELAAAMVVTPGTATSMVKTLADAGLVDYQPRTGVRLTLSGKKLALVVLRRHRLVELFLVQVLGLDWAEVHHEAEALEHVVSDRVIEQMDRVLGYPGVDPHGDPIPDARGDLTRRDHTPLTARKAGTSVRIGRIINQEPTFLRFLEKSGLRPGTRIKVLAVSPEADSISLKPAGSAPVINMGFSAASTILTEG